MRVRAAAGAGAAACVLCSLLVLAGCSDSGGSPGGTSTPKSASADASGDASEPSPSSYAETTYFGVDECAAPEPDGADGAYREADCEDADATGVVLTRFDEEPGGGGISDVFDIKGTNCPLDSDFAIDITESLSAMGVAASPGASRNAYACMRNLKPPHPSDPGKDGGTGIVVGDCVRTTESEAAEGSSFTWETISEAPCDGEGDDQPGYKVFEIVTHTVRSPSEACPSGRTDLPFDTEPRSLLGGASADPYKDIACAKAL